MNCAEKLLEPTIFFNLHQVTIESGSESPWRKGDFRPAWNLESKS